MDDVLETQTLQQQKPKTMKIEVRGSLPNKVGAKDIILAIIGRLALPEELAMY